MYALGFHIRFPSRFILFYCNTTRTYLFAFSILDDIATARAFEARAMDPNSELLTDKEMPSKRIPKPNPRYREIAADPPTDKSESSSIMNGKLLVSPSTDRALFDRSDDEILSGNEPPTKKTTETSNLKCNCIGSFFVL